MKRIRMLLMIAFLIALVFVLAGCTCDPAAHMWEVISFSKNTVYLNGVEQVDQYGVVTFIDPFGGMEDGIVSIVFTEDGTVTFTPGTGETLTGTFTTKDNGMQDTSFTVTLDNGETFSGKAVSYYYGRSLEFAFRGNAYRFEEAYETAETLYEKTIQNQIRWIRYAVFDKGLLTIGEITADAGRYTLTIEGEKTPRVLDQTVAVQCVRLDAENNLTMLDAIELGECYCAIGQTYSGMDKIVIYYIEPLPEDPTPPEPDYTFLPEFEGWLIDVFTVENIAEIKTTFEYVGVAPGEFKNVKRTTDQAVIAQVLEFYADTTMTQIAREETLVEGGSTFMIEFILTDGTVKRLHFNNCNYVYRPDPDDASTFACFRLDSVPTLEGYGNVTASYEFVTNNDTGKVYGDAGLLCQIPLEELEFIELTEELGDSTQQKYYVETEFGNLVFFTDTVFYIDFPIVGHTDCYQLVGKTIDELIAEYSITK